MQLESDSFFHNHSGVSIGSCSVQGNRWGERVIDCIQGVNQMFI